LLHERLDILGVPVEVMRLMGLRAILAGVIALEPKLELQVFDVAGLASRVRWMMEVPERLPIQFLPGKRLRQR
jgi:hypothetical protein